jgi:hypothetical protein
MRIVLSDADGNRRTREEMRAVTVTEKVRALEAFQAREYARLEALSKKDGRSIPRKWQRWKRAQEAVER